MARLEFSYTAIPVPPNSLHPDGRVAHRPMLPLLVDGGFGRQEHCFGLVDSGADACLFPLRLARQMGLNLLELRQSFSGGVGSSHNLTYYAQVDIDLGNGYRFNTLAGFTEGMDRAGFALLGQLGFFESYTVELRYSDRSFFLEPTQHTHPSIRVII